MLRETKEMLPILEDVAQPEDMYFENNCNQLDGNVQQIFSEDNQCDDVYLSEAEQERKIRLLRMLFSWFNLHGCVFLW